MECKIIKVNNNWDLIKKACYLTIGKKVREETVSTEWKFKILKAEHSPIRMLIVHARWIDIPYWVSVHLVRHKVGIEHFVRSQREDRTGVRREILSQSSLVEHEIIINAQAMITISRKRLCNKASKETREAWSLFLSALESYEPELVSCCLPDCDYRGRCYEFTSCMEKNE